jgi:hypothetical protein
VRRLERPVLGESVTRERRALRSLGYLDAHGWCIGSGNARRSQHGILRKYFVVDLGNQVILAIGVAAPDLPELDGTNRHDSFPECSELAPDYRGV